MKKSWKIYTPIIALFIALLTLLFGDNLIGRIFQDKEKKEFPKTVKTENTSVERDNTKSVIPLDSINKFQKRIEYQSEIIENKKKKKIFEILTSQNEAYSKNNLLFNSFDFPDSEERLDNRTLYELDEILFIQNKLKSEETFFDYLFAALDLEKESPFNAFYRIEFIWNYNYYRRHRELGCARKFFNSNKENLKRLFLKYEDRLYDFIPNSLYRSANIDIAVNNLINTYKHLTSLSGWEFLFKESYNKNLISKEELGLLYNENNITVFQEEVANCWFFSFWVRRHREGNMEMVYSFLVKIKKHYN